MDPLDHLTSLITNVPSWLLILDEQKDQLGRRQAELARISESSQHHPSISLGTSSRSLKNKGSAESLRPRANTRLEEQDEEAIYSDGNENGNPVEGLKNENGLSAQTKQSNSHPAPENLRASQRKASGSNKCNSIHLLPFSYSNFQSPTCKPRISADICQSFVRRCLKNISLHFTDYLRSTGTSYETQNIQIFLPALCALLQFTDPDSSH